MNGRWGIFASSCILGIAVCAASAQQASKPATGAGGTSLPAAVELQKGIYTEEVSGDLDGAIKIYQQVIAEAKAARPYVAQAHLRLAMAYLKKGDKDKSRQAFREILANYPQETQIVAAAQRQLEKIDPNARTAASGMASSHAASDEDKAQAENLTTEGWALWGQRKLAEAEEKFSLAVKKDPSNANAWNGLGWSQFNQGKPTNAKVSFEKAVAIDAKAAASWNGLGWIAKNQKKTDQAIEYWKKSVDAAPNATAALSGLASTYMEINQPDKAVEYYQMWLSAEPTSAEAKAGLEKARAAAKPK